MFFATLSRVEVRQMKNICSINRARLGYNFIIYFKFTCNMPAESISALMLMVVSKRLRSAQ